MDAPKGLSLDLCSLEGAGFKDIPYLKPHKFITYFRSQANPLYARMKNIVVWKNEKSFDKQYFTP